MCSSLDWESTRDSRLESMSTPRQHPDSKRLELFRIRNEPLLIRNWTD